MPVPFYLRPRMLALHVVTLVTLLALIGLGLWQFNRWDTSGSPKHAATADRLSTSATPAESATPLLDIEQVLKPAKDFPSAAQGRVVSVTGIYLLEAQVLLPGRTREGVPGFWVLTALGTPNGPAVAVLRGWVRTPEEAVPVPLDFMKVTGRLQQAEPVDISGKTLPAGQAQSANPAVLASFIDRELFPGILVLEQQTPSFEAAPSLVQVRVEGGGRGGGALRNLVYATQWWSFGGFAIWVWSRLVRDAAASTAPTASTASVDA